MLGPQHFPLLVRYFDGVDLTLSRQLQRPVPASETTLTQSFCALMDAGSQRREGQPAFGIDQLNAELAQLGDGLEASMRIDTSPHGAYFEANISQADFGLVLEYRNTFKPGYDWTAAYLMQAKRLFPSRTGEYDLASCFESCDAKQHQRIVDLVDFLGAHAVKYFLYCPPVSGFARASATAIRNRHILSLGGAIFDYGLGLAFRDAIRSKGGCDAGIWLTGADRQPSDALTLQDAAYRAAHPFTWFILGHFQPDVQGHPGLSGGATISGPLNATHAIDAELVERTRGIADGDADIVRELLDHLGERARKADIDPEDLKVLPAGTITVTVRAGPPESFDQADRT